MKRNLSLLFLPMSLAIVNFANTIGLKAKASSINGADIYCLMRQGGNEHNASWEAAYQSIKNRKKEGLFKTSPKQAAAMIVENVVQDPVKYEDCVTYLGDLYIQTELPIDKEEEEKDQEKSSKGELTDRYSY